MNIHNFLLNITRRIFVMEFIAEFVLIYPFYAIMVGARGGVDAAGLGILLAVWQVTSVVAEVPTGILADRLSKKWSMIIGKSLRIVAFALWLIFPGFWGYLAGFMALGAGDSFMSGAFQAYLYESLSDQHRSGFSRIYSRASSMTMLAYTLAYIVSFLVGPVYEVLLICSLGVSCVSLIICITLPNTRTHRDIELKPQILTESLKTLRTSRLLRNLLIAAVTISALAMMLIEYIPVYYHQVGVPIRYVPLLLAAGNAITVVLFWTMHRYERTMVRYQIPIILLLCVGYVVSSTQGMYVSIAGILIFMRFARLLVVNRESNLQKHVPDHIRATILSIYSFAAKLLSAGTIMLIGYMAVDNRVVEPIRIIIITGVALFVLFQLYFRTLTSPS